MTRKIILVLILGAVLTGGIFADWWNSYATEDNLLFINAGIGLGPTGGYNMGIPPLSASVDVKLPVPVPITVGGILIYSRWKYSAHSHDFAWNNIGIGARGMYHFNFLPNLDVYAGLTFGYVIQTFSGDSNYYNGNSFFLWGFGTGGRYYFTNNIGAYVELGYSGLQFISTGISLKF
jgi:hypothetical protein